MSETEIDMSKPVKVLLHTEVVYTCNSVQEAEEWIVDEGDRDQEPNYQIETDKATVAANLDIARNPASTETPEVEPINDIALLRGVLGTILLRMDEMSDPDGNLVAYDGPELVALEAARAEAQQALDRVPDSAAHPHLKVYDEMISQGRSDLIDFLDSGDPAQAIEPIPISLGGTYGGETEGRPLLRPMPAGDAHRWVRRRADEVVNAISVVPTFFAVPGLQPLLLRLATAVRVPTLDSYRGSTFPGGTYEAMLPVLASVHDYDEAQLRGVDCTVDRGKLNLPDGI